MKKFCFTITLVALISLPLLSFAWGKIGHSIVAEVAYSMLDKHTKDAVKEALGSTTLEEAASWMDEVRRQHEYDYMKSWHYVNIAKGANYVATKEDNIVNALNTAIHNLEHKDKLSAEELKMNLMVVFHLVGDLHQPLHVGYEDDKGGNTVQVQYLGKNGNLHTIWDSRIIESEHIKLDDCLVLAKRMTPAEITRLKEINIERWIQQPRPFLNDVYNFQSNTLDQAYADRNKKIIEQQLTIAGIRLASVLEHTFKS